MFQVELEGSTLEWFNSDLKVLFNKVEYFTCNAFWKKISVSLVYSWSFNGMCPFLYWCFAYCSFCICCCNSETGLTLLHSALNPVSSSGSRARLWNLTIVVERTVSLFPRRSGPFISSAFIWFSFFKDSRESVIESRKKYSMSHQLCLLTWHTGLVMMV